jgi:hypothetical protein
MDFGFLWDSPDGTLGCYASNNVAFERELRCTVPPPEGDLRCNCFAHAQLLKRRGTPVLHVSDALVVHALPDLAKERHRRGYDLVAACWNDPLLRESAWLGPPETSAMRFIDDAVKLDAQRFHGAPPELGLDARNRDAVAAEILRLRELDLEGVRLALSEGEANGRNAQARAAHAHWREARRNASGGA